ncbi:hypothetical protein PtrSN002B_004151 [Pyrenophora tritici-repentis]|uniref:Uncharacterized protein n=2 Tax=Pyrenophora tritici-repentis TaxID=45151 RepID=A0A2W1FRX6_9PLEO|nr:uncharacterized protein PTRG_10922 [Pyrenophora tritici-repentis Pt-1C-BFP]KAA8618099.1 hypothetical protein PtrV1_09606 [Pyrenophora tritici-repentis]EDU43972.1 predicted protein [Pyrenophora tritici-repentis Pt-1C-BFP]KAF7442941.1 hypothetical protein A1F99_124480 [Pyrenophora tritici-repentis]KAF7568598.1 hypothetical protein PtrM4_132110 [Pyrenophora tritici-repentis]KAG9376452.1 hypothetical protein A1F94_012999 [Pyrenophora tritici-repentis]
MAEQPQPHNLSSMSIQFRSAVDGLTNEWGYIIVRTDYATEIDEAQWTAALEKLRAYAGPHPNDTAQESRTLALPVIADNKILCDADYATLRKAFNGWVDDYSGQDKKWPSDIRDDCFIVIDKLALDSLLNAPDNVPGEVLKFQNPDMEPWVVIVDSEDPASFYYNGGGPYMGFTRVNTYGGLGELFLDLSCDLSLEEKTPIGRYDGQIPLFDGTPKGKLVDPAGGVEERHKFPYATPEGPEGAQAMLDQINQALGTSYTLRDDSDSD